MVLRLKRVSHTSPGAKNSIFFKMLVSSYRYIKGYQNNFVPVTVPVTGQLGLRDLRVLRVLRVLKVLRALGILRELRFSFSAFLMFFTSRVLRIRKVLSVLKIPRVLRGTRTDLLRSQSQ